MTAATKSDGLTVDGLLFLCDEAACHEDPMFYEIFSMDDRWDQSYGIAMAQCNYGGPRGVWLECRSCDRSDRIKDARTDISDADAAKIFRKGGWTGRTARMLGAKCPSCSVLLQERS